MSGTLCGLPENLAQPELWRGLVQGRGPAPRGPGAAGGAERCCWLLGAVAAVQRPGTVGREGVWCWGLVLARGAAAQLQVCQPIGRSLS